MKKVFIKNYTIKNANSLKIKKTDCFLRQSVLVEIIKNKTNMKSFVKNYFSRCCKGNGFVLIVQEKNAKLFMI